MHRNTKRLTAALLVAALCFAAAPQAFAEPWTYEVDDVMSGYGVEFYPDVGFENPSRNTDASQEQSGSGASVSTYGGDSAQAVVSTPTAANHGVITYRDTDPAVSTYSAVGQAAAVETGTAAGTMHEVSVYSAGGFNVYTASSTTTTNNTYTDNKDYTVTIPAEVPVDTTTNKGAFTITTQLGQCCNLEVKISSQENGAFGAGNKGTLTCDTEKLPYKISDTKLVFWKDANVTDTTSDSYTVDVQVLDTTIISGTYTDHLTFDMTPYNYTNDSTGRHLLNFDTNAGNDAVTISTTSKFVENNKAYGMLPTPKRDGYTFVGWYTAASGGTKVDENTSAGTADTTVYAHWTGNKLTILYHNDGADYIDWDSDPAGTNREYTGADQGTYEYKTLTATGTKKYVVFDETSKANDTITLMEVETYGQGFTNGVNGLFNASRWHKTGYRLNYAPAGTTPGGGLWKIGKNGTKTCGEGDISGWTVKDCAEALGVLEELMQGDVTVDLYPDWYQTGKTAAESDDELWDDEPVTLLPSWDEISPVVVDMPTVDAPADADSTAPADDTAKADTTDPAEEAPEATPLDRMLWDAGDLAALPDMLQFEDAGFGV